MSSGRRQNQGKGANADDDDDEKKKEKKVKKEKDEGEEEEEVKKRADDAKKKAKQETGEVTEKDEKVEVPVDQVKDAQKEADSSKSADVGAVRVVFDINELLKVISSSLSLRLRPIGQLTISLDAVRTNAPRIVSSLPVRFEVEMIEGGTSGLVRQVIQSVDVAVSDEELYNRMRYYGSFIKAMCTWVSEHFFILQSPETEVMYGAEVPVTSKMGCDLMVLSGSVEDRVRTMMRNLIPMIATRRFVGEMEVGAFMTRHERGVYAECYALLERTANFRKMGLIRRMRSFMDVTRGINFGAALGERFFNTDDGRMLNAKMGNMPGMNSYLVRLFSLMFLPSLELPVFKSSDWSSIASVNATTRSEVSDLISYIATGRNREELGGLMMALLLPHQVRAEVIFDRTDLSESLWGVSSFIAKMLLSTTPLARNITEEAQEACDHNATTFLLKHGYLRNVNAGNQMRDYAFNVIPEQRARGQNFAQQLRSGARGEGWINGGVRTRYGVEDFGLESPYDAAITAPLWGGLVDFANHEVNGTWMGERMQTFVRIVETLRQGDRVCKSLAAIIESCVEQFHEFMAKVNLYQLRYCHTGLRMSDDQLGRLDELDVRASEEPFRVVVHASTLIALLKQIPSEMIENSNSAKVLRVESALSSELSVFFTLYGFLDDAFQGEGLRGYGASTRTAMIRDAYSFTILGDLLDIMQTDRFRDRFRLVRNMGRMRAMTDGIFRNLFHATVVDYEREPEVYGFTRDVVWQDRETEEIALEGEAARVRGVLGVNNIEVGAATRLNHLAVDNHLLIGDLRRAVFQANSRTGNKILLPYYVPYTVATNSAWSAENQTYVVKRRGRRTDGTVRETLDLGRFTHQYVVYRDEVMVLPDDRIPETSRLSFWYGGRANFVRRLNQPVIAGNIMRIRVLTSATTVIDVNVDVDMEEYRTASAAM